MPQGQMTFDDLYFPTRQRRESRVSLPAFRTRDGGGIEAFKGAGVALQRAFRTYRDAVRAKLEEYTTSNAIQEQAHGYLGRYVVAKTGAERVNRKTGEILPAWGRFWQEGKRMGREVESDKGAFFATPFPRGFREKAGKVPGVSTRRFMRGAGIAAPPRPRDVGGVAAFARQALHRAGHPYAKRRKRKTLPRPAWFINMWTGGIARGWMMPEIRGKGLYGFRVYNRAPYATRLFKGQGPWIPRPTIPVAFAETINEHERALKLTHAALGNMLPWRSLPISTRVRPENWR
jgi:hypothetical protein